MKLKAQLIENEMNAFQIESFVVICHFLISSSRKKECREKFSIPFRFEGLGFDFSPISTLLKSSFSGYFGRNEQVRYIKEVEN